MAFRRGNWIGFGITGFCFAVLGLAIFSVQYGSMISDPFFGRLCHQFNDRCYHINGVALPICVRCVWIYLGMAIGHSLFLFWKPESRRITRALVGVIALMFIDVMFERVGVYNNLFWTRALTGFLFGLIVSHFTLLGLRELYCELTNPITYVRSRFFSSRSR